MGLTEELGLDRPVETVEHESLLNIIYTGTMIARASFRYFQNHKLTDAQFNVLMQLKYANGNTLSQVVLSRRLVVNKADMTGIIDRLERDRLVERRVHPGDRRVNMVRMTKKGAAVAGRLEPGYFEGLGRVMSGIPSADLKKLNRTLERIRGNIREIMMPQAKK